MKKLYLILSITALFMAACSDNNNEKYGISSVYAANLQGEGTNENTVYICTGPNSKRYHSHSDCRGLGKCSGEIKEVSVSKAKSMGRTPCKWCY